MTTRRPMRPIKELGIYIPPKTKWEKFCDKLDTFIDTIFYYILAIVLFFPAQIYLAFVRNKSKEPRKTPSVPPYPLE